MDGASRLSVLALASPGDGIVTPRRGDGGEANISAAISQLCQHIVGPVLPLLEVERGRRRKLFVPEEDRR